MALKQVRDDKDPQPVAPPTRQAGDGNVPAKGEGHEQGKAERVKEDARFTVRNTNQPTREEGDGNTPLPAGGSEQHGQKKAERVPADRRF